jgi:acyl-CoA synthetase (AMP-forming)/AMP-acid ligase II
VFTAVFDGRGVRYRRSFESTHVEDLLQPANSAGAGTLVDLLRQRAAVYGDKVAFSFSYHGDDESVTELTFRELDRRARAIGARLQQQGAAGERVLVLCRPGLDCIVGFFGAVCAAAVAVPVHERLAPRLSAVVPDADARFALATAATRGKLKAAVDELGEGPDLYWCATDDDVDGEEEWVAPDGDSDAVAMIQYTSGSTAAPKGVMLTHRNLLHNVEACRRVWHGDDTANAVFWLPSHHDMGLIGGVISVLHTGCTTYLMSPSSFIERPMRWLESVSRHRATLTVAPNFAYDLCVEQSSVGERAALDLSSLTTAMNGAEPVRAATLDRFAESFAPAGLRREAMRPVYGLAEATLIVSGDSSTRQPSLLHADRAELNDGRVVEGEAGPSAVTLVGSGRPCGGQEVLVVDPVTRLERGAEEVGEIWVAGPSIGVGYWNRPEETEQTFRAHLCDGRGPFLRTGDLGFVSDGEVFVTERVHDLVVIRGANHYPNDLEYTAQRSDPMLVAGRGAVFTVTPEPSAVEQLVVVQEVDDLSGSEALLEGAIRHIRTAIATHHGIEPRFVHLVKHRSIATTSSGKIQRGRCRLNFLTDELESLAHWYAPGALDDLAKARYAEAAVHTANLLRLAEADRQRSPDVGGT